ncbi:SWIM zinc finger domain-containing protein [Candidatus Chloroploca sp. M-50]|uniref:SWIM zinc finger domain-containing protein n=1 Tax=Candidatus Chloroploca mongolica TaxID=2528176 RepID=A0ABS4DET7_9CHLR|nr:SWIM zinc finger family protein [Candidatus Chloroploca mongolica]MBP1467964.1 SWIM zinc finger domain-containing protein [Candidatus Chloroploca mongolica]
MDEKPFGGEQAQRPALSEAQIRQYASGESFARGRHYAEEGAVGSLVLRGDLLRAEVEGSAYAPYRVTVRIDAGGVRAASCTCPYDWGGWCKHIIATLLVYAKAEPDAIEVRPPLAALLARLERDQLEALVLHLAAQDAELTEQIDAMIGASVAAPVASPSSEDGSVAARRTAIDATAFRTQIRRIFRAERADDYEAYERILANLDPLVEQIRSLCDDNNAQDALPLLEALTDEYTAAWIDYDDSDGELGAFFFDLGELWALALLGAPLKKAELNTWRERLEGWAANAEAYGCDGLNLALQAATEGWSEPWIDAAILGEARPDAQPTGAHAGVLLSIRLLILEHSGHTQEALNLAAAAGMHREQVLLLVRMGRVAEAVALGRQHFTNAMQAFSLAHALHERGELEQALAIGEHGLSLGAVEPSSYAQEQARARWAAWLSDLAAGQGRIDLALRTGAEALRVTPELGLYQRLAELAGAHPEAFNGGWPALREQLLAALRTNKGWMIAGKIDIFLHEGLLDHAIAALGTRPSSDDLVRVMDAAMKTHPDWVIRAATSRATEIMDASKAQYYEDAVGWLVRARDAYKVAGRMPDWKAYLQSLRLKHGRKRKLIGLMDIYF